MFESFRSVHLYIYFLFPMFFRLVPSVRSTVLAGRSGHDEFCCSGPKFTSWKDAICVGFVWLAAMPSFDLLVFNVILFLF